MLPEERLCQLQLFLSGRLSLRPFCMTTGTRLTNIGGDSLVWVCRVNTGHGAVNSAQVYYRKGDLESLYYRMGDLESLHSFHL